jgi:hypothetical protein
VQKNFDHCGQEKEADEITIVGNIQRSGYARNTLIPKDYTIKILMM